MIRLTKPEQFGNAAFPLYRDASDVCNKHIQFELRNLARALKAYEDGMDSILGFSESENFEAQHLSDCIGIIRNQVKRILDGEQ